jgi:antitoxin CcdA
MNWWTSCIDLAAGLPGGTGNCRHPHSMRIMCALTRTTELTMDTHPASTRKRPVNLTLNEALVIQARTYTDNLSATMESLLADYVRSQQEARRDRQIAVDACVADWNALLGSTGSFADDHTTL